MGWIRVDSAMHRHRKVRKFARLMDMSELAATGAIVTLWSEVSDQAPSGVLTDWSDDDVAVAMTMPREVDPTRLVECLCEAGLLDRGKENVLEIHDWDDFQHAHRERERKAKWRRKQRDETSASGDGDGTGTSTETPASGGGDVRARARRTNERTNERDGTDGTEAQPALELEGEPGPPPGTWVFPTKHGKGQFLLGHFRVAELIEDFPSLDVPGQLRRIRAHYRAHLPEAPTERGYPGAITKWLKRSEANGWGPQASQVASGGAGSSRPAAGAQARSERNAEAAARARERITGGGAS